MLALVLYYYQVKGIETDEGKEMTYDEYAKRLREYLDSEDMELTENDGQFWSDELGWVSIPGDDEE